MRLSLRGDGEGLDAVPLQGGTLGGICGQGPGRNRWGRRGLEGGRLSPPRPDISVWPTLFFPEIPRPLSDTQPCSSGKSFKESSYGLPQATPKHAPVCCPPKALPLPEPPPYHVASSVLSVPGSGRRTFAWGAESTCPCFFSARPCRAGSTCPSLGR